MATLDSLKQALRQKAQATASCMKQPLTDTEYSAGFDILLQGSEWETYQDFIIPQLSQLLTPLFNSRAHISVLEIGPGPKSILGYLASHLRHKVTKYTAFEPNSLFATRLEEWLCSTSMTEYPLPCLEKPANIHRIPFVPQDNIGSDAIIGTTNNDEKYDIILFCHSMYGMKPKRRFIEQALAMLVEQPRDGMVVVLHRDTLYLDGLVCHQTASYPSGVVSVANSNEALDRFTPFIAGFNMQNADMDMAVRIEWREMCRALGRSEDAHPNQLLFSSPNIMTAFTRNATALPELTANVPLGMGDKTIKNREARVHRPASIVRPTYIQHVQQCVRWALKHGAGLTVIGGGHSGHCLWPNVVSVDMSAFDQVHILTGEAVGERHPESDSDSTSLVVVESGCKTGDVITKTLAAGLTVPLGSRPSVGAGLWLQGGIGHLARQHGLACDAIVGAVVVSVASGRVFCVGHVPVQHEPIGAVRSKNEADMLWALRGAGTNVGIVISVTFKAYTAPIYAVRSWIIPLSDNLEARLKLTDFDRQVASQLPRNSSADAYLYWDNDQLHLGVTVFEPSTSRAPSSETPSLLSRVLGPEDDFKTVDSLGLFETEMYMSGMHGGHGSGKTSSFKRCVFLKYIGAANIADILIAAVETRPSPLCYLHLLHGGGAIGDVAAEATAFGCQDWDFAAVVTGVWPRDQDGTEASRAVVEWVYKIIGELMPLSCGVYSADLGPDPRDVALAAKAFGPNQQRLADLKHSFDPHSVLAYACPLPVLSKRSSRGLQFIILVTGENGAGKDYCADIWASIFARRTGVAARAISISEETKGEYAAATGADLKRLLGDRTYKEQHRSALTAFFKSQVRQRPRLPEEHFQNVVHGAGEIDVLLITGMRDEAPLATLSHLVPESRLLDVRVQAGEELRLARRGNIGSNGDSNHDQDHKGKLSNGRSDMTVLDYCPTLIFDNNTTGNKAAEKFAEQYLLPFVHDDLQRLASMVRQVSNFPRPGTDFRHVLGIPQEPGGLALCTSLLQTHFIGDLAKVDVVTCCEAGGFVFASALSSRIDKPLVPIREAGKLPPPTISVIKPSSYISSLASSSPKEKRIEMERDAIPKGASVLLVDDVLSTGKTLCAVLQLLSKAGISTGNISVMVVAEFPFQRGRELLRQHGFGNVRIQSLLVFSGA